MLGRLKAEMIPVLVFAVGRLTVIWTVLTSDDVDTAFAWPIYNLMLSGLVTDGQPSAAAWFMKPCLCFESRETRNMCVCMCVCEVSVLTHPINLVGHLMVTIISLNYGGLAFDPGNDMRCFCPSVFIQKWRQFFKIEITGSLFCFVAFGIIVAAALLNSFSCWMTLRRRVGVFRRFGNTTVFRNIRQHPQIDPAHYLKWKGFLIITFCKRRYFPYNRQSHKWIWKKLQIS